MNKSETNKIRKKITNKNKWKSWQIILLSISGIGLVIATTFAIIFFMHEPFQDDKEFPFHLNVNMPGDFKDENAPKLSGDGKISRKAGVYNFLVVGCDKDGLNTDVIMIMSYDVKNNDAFLAQVPRDTYVQINRSGGRKINSVFAKGYISARTELNSLKKQASDIEDEALKDLVKKSSLSVDYSYVKQYIDGTINANEIYTRNGMALLEDVLKDTLGVIIDYGVFLDLEGFRNIVDIIGGVEIDVKQDMKYSDPEQDLYINLKAGKQTLNGKKAEEFVRFRSGYANGDDLSRLDAQKQFMTAFFNSLTSSSTISKIPKLLEEVEKHVISNISFADALYFGKAALSLDMSQMSMITWPGSPKYYNGGSYFSLNKATTLETVNKNLNVFDTDIPESALTIVDLLILGKNTSSNNTTAPVIPKTVEQTEPEYDNKNNSENSENSDENSNDSQESSETSTNDSLSEESFDGDLFGLNPSTETNEQEQKSELNSPDGTLSEAVSKSSETDKSSIINTSNSLSEVNNRSDISF